MAKRSQRRPVRHEREQLGCMWGLISIFDFRQGRSTRKLLSDRKRGSRHAVGSGDQKNMLDNLDENCQGTIDGEASTTAAADAGKPSVKKLIEEEMFREQDMKKEMENAEVEPKQSNSEHGGHKKNRKRTNRSRSKSCDIYLEHLDVAGNLEPEQTCLQNLEKQSPNSLNIDEIMEEVHHQIHQKSISSVEHDQNDEAHAQPNQKNPEFEEKLTEAIKLIREKRFNRKQVTEDGDLPPSKELRDALQILSSDEEFFLKLLQGPKSTMVKYFQNLQNAQLEKDEVSNSLPGSNFTEKELHDLRQSDEVIHSKQRSFFRRRTKLVEKNPLKGSETSQALNRIVILKPGPTGLQNPETESALGSLPESQFIMRNKEPNEGIGSHFFLTEIKRKLKHAMGMERQEIFTDGTSKRSPKKRQSLVDIDKGSKENLGRSSPSKDHFFIEKIARPPNGIKKREKSGKLKECEINVAHETANYPKPSVSNIYIEAKKHLCEMLSDGPEDVDFSNRQVPKTLGRILSLAEYSSSPIDSPGRDWEQTFVTAQMRLSTNEDFQKQENYVSPRGRTLLNLDVSDESTNNKVQALSEPNSNISNKLFHDIKAEKTNCATGDMMTSEGDVEIVKATEIVVQKESSSLDTSSESCSSLVAGDDQNCDILEACDEKENSECLKQVPYEERQSPSSPLTSPSTSSINKKVNDIEGVSEMPDRPSPISVLEPLFTEEDISPASTRSQPGRHSYIELPMQPLRIPFEEHDLSAADQNIHFKVRVEGKESIFEYVKGVLLASGVNWDDFYMRSHSSDQLLDPSIFLEVEVFSNDLCCDKKLLFDCISEVLMEVYGRYFGCFPGLSFVKSTIRPVPNVKNTICEVWEGVCWHFLPLSLPHTLEQIVKKDMAKAGTWMDLQYDTETILVGIGEAIFEDLMEETLLSCINESSGSEYPSIPAELKANESSIDL